MGFSANTFDNAVPVKWFPKPLARGVCHRCVLQSGCVCCWRNRSWASGDSLLLEQQTVPERASSQSFAANLTPSHVCASAGRCFCFFKRKQLHIWFLSVELRAESAVTQAWKTTSSSTHFLHKTPQRLLDSKSTGHLLPLNWGPFETARALPTRIKLGKGGSSPCGDAKDACLQMIHGRALNTPWAPHWRTCTHKATQTFHHLKRVPKWSPDTTQELIL